MSKLASLHSQLATLKQTRATARLATAFAALVTAILWSLAAIFVLDVVFELPLVPRLIVMVLGALGSFWAFNKYTQPMLGVSESELDMALLVERQQKIDSDLVAALQFESPEAGAWGSRQLETAVIDYVAEFGRGLNVFEGFSREQMVRRLVVLGLTLAVVLGFVLIAPTYAAVFLNRLCLGARHYPTSTVIDRIVVNQATVLVKEVQGSSPRNMKAAQGQAMQFYIQTSGDKPASGTLRVRSAAGGASRPVDLKPLTLDERASRLRAASARLETAIAQAQVDISTPWRQEVNSLLVFDAPEAARRLAELQDDRSKLAGVRDEVQRVLAAWPGTAGESAVFAGDMGRLVDDVRYNIYLGDAWTDPAGVQMIPLPVVELDPKIVPPTYARSAKDANTGSSRQVSVLEGSAVELSLRCVNEKPLKEAWITTKVGDTSQKLALTRTDKAGLAWTLDAAGSPFRKVSDEIRYEVQVTDEDDLHLDTPIRGSIRIRPDRAPSGLAEVVHRVVLPTAKPVIGYRLNDDFGISKLVLRVETEREGEKPAPAAASDGSEGTDSNATDAVSADPGSNSQQDSPVTFTLHSLPKPPLLTMEPIRGSYELDLSPLKLVKGDRLKLTLEITDYRGEAPGVAQLSDPLILEISDESGVLAAISEADERSEERLTDIIKKQLGIGESP